MSIYHPLHPSRLATATKLCAGMLIAMVTIANGQSHAQTYKGGLRTRATVVKPVNDAERVTLTGNTAPYVTPETDLGPVVDSMPLDHLQLVLKRPPEVEQALEDAINAMQKPGSPTYHQWLTAEQFGALYGPSAADVAQVTNWLQSQGFSIDGIPASGMFIEFSGDAAMVKQAFHTEIHNLNVKGEAHFGNVSDPQIPAALAGVVIGVHALHNFMPHPMMKKRVQPQFTTPLPAGPIPQLNGSSTFYAVGPQDFATIYNLNPAFAEGLTGQGQTIVVLGDTLIKNVSDWSTFRTAFGLSGYSGASFTQVSPTGASTCKTPAVNGHEGEAALDAEWASATAPGATIELAACTNTTVFGGLLALQNIINGTAPPKIVSMSYGECEAQNGSTANRSFYVAYQQAVAEGISVFVSAGDQGAASCDTNTAAASSGIAVSGFASTPYNVAVGGTDFGDTYAAKSGGPAVTQYWNPANSATFSSALSYIPEIPWDDSCASSLIYQYEGATQAYGTTGFCNTTTGMNYQTLGAGSGGPSTYSAQPSWQTGVVGLPTSTGGNRYLPDVSLFAADGVWNHFLVYCMTDATQGGVPCTYSNTTDVEALAAGGTSFSSPAMAGIQALINQSTGTSAGNPAPRLYQLAGLEYGSTGSPTCNSQNGPTGTSNCVFYDITLGDIDVNCTGTINCFGYSKVGTTVYDGVLSTSSTTLSPAYPATTGWDYATGLGSLNVYNLIQNWISTPTTTVITTGTPSVAATASVTFTATVTPGIGSLTAGTVTWSANTGCASVVLSTGNTATCTTSFATAGTPTVTASYSDGSTPVFTSSTGSFLETVTLLPNTILFTQPASPAPAGGTATLVATATSGGPVTFTVTPGTGTASITGNVITYLTTGTVTVNADSAATSTYAVAPTVSDTVTINNIPYVFVAGSGKVASLNAAGAVSTTGVANGGVGAAIDATGNLWSLNPNGTSLSTFTPAGAFFKTYTPTGLTAASVLAIDGNSNIIIGNGNGIISVVSNAGAAVSTSAGSTSAAPSGIAIDLSGNIWIANPGASTIDEVIGGAAPAAPLANAVQTNNPGTKP